MIKIMEIPLVIKKNDAEHCPSDCIFTKNRASNGWCRLFDEYIEYEYEFQDMFRRIACKKCQALYNKMEESNATRNESVER